eukprot:TRINITY_DN2108_c0_g1_i1.p1 TRINITY_DN2108_c0_g1~~TRINITY_DN2108_c0_g1_i1.p1  ORF type:complete len:822 (-),score=101.41 TRINITY_DN2108_c0_g1_i1:901-3366(-)
MVSRVWRYVFWSREEQPICFPPAAWLFCILLYLSISNRSSAQRVDLLPSSSINEKHWSTYLVAQNEDSSSVTEPFTFTWLQCPQPLRSDGSDHLNDAPINLSVQLQCDVLSRISSGPPAVKLSAYMASINLDLEPSQASSFFGALDLVAASHSSVPGSIPVLDVKIVAHAEGSIAAPYVIANSSFAVPSVYYEIGLQQCRKSTEPCASPLLSIPGAYLKGSEGQAGSVYVSHIDIPYQVCAKDSICRKAKQVVISLRNPSSGSVSVLGAYGDYRDTSAKRAVYAAPRSPIPAPVAPPPIEPPVAPVNFSAVMVVIASALGVLLLGGLAYFGYRMYLKNKHRRPPATSPPPSPSKKSKENPKNQRRKKMKKPSPQSEQVEVELDEPEPVLRKQEFQTLLSDFKTTIAELEASGELGLRLEQAQRHISDADKAALSRILANLKPNASLAKSKKNKSRPKKKVASRVPAPRQQTDGHSQLIESAESPRVDATEAPPLRNAPSVSSGALRLNLSPVDDLYRGIDLRSLSARPPPSPIVQEITQQAIKLKRKVSKSFSRAITRKPMRPRAEVHVSGLTSTNPITGEAVTDTATLSIMFPPVFGVPDGYAFLQPRAPDNAQYNTALHSTTSSDEATNDPSFSESFDASSFSIPSYMRDPGRKTTVQLFGTARHNAMEGSTEISYFDVTDDSYRSDSEAASRVSSHVAASEEASQDNSDAPNDDERSIGWGSESESEPQRPAPRKLTVALPVISVDHLWSPRAASARGSETAEPVGTCYICKIKDANAIFEPCRHGGICITCARNLAKLPKAKCAICRHLIISVSRTL